MTCVALPALQAVKHEAQQQAATLRSELASAREAASSVAEGQQLSGQAKALTAERDALQKQLSEVRRTAVTCGLLLPCSSSAAA